MKIWLVMYETGHDGAGEIVEAFDSRQKAGEYIAERKRESSGFADAEGYYIEARDVV